MTKMNSPIEVRELTACELGEVSGGVTGKDVWNAFLTGFYCGGSTTTTTNIAYPDGSVHSAATSTPNCTPA